MAWPARAIIPARLHDQRVCLPPLFCVLFVLRRTPREAVTLWRPLTAWRGPQLALRHRARRTPLPHIANDFRTCFARRTETTQPLRVAPSISSFPLAFATTAKRRALLPNTGWSSSSSTHRHLGRNHRHQGRAMRRTASGLREWHAHPCSSRIDPASRRLQCPSLKPKIFDPCRGDLMGWFAPFCVSCGRVSMRRVAARA
jgi:hypothetical protein